MVIVVADSSQVATARRAASDFAVVEGFDDTQAGRVALIATEIATNLLKHASSGELIVGRYEDSSGAGVELLGLDKGEGITNLTQSLQDGYSTAGSSGTGLGAIRRLADQFEVFSRPGGTAILARIGRTAAAVAAGTAAMLGAVVVPYPGENVSGDAWTFGTPNGKPTLLAVDGSGHGPMAHAAAAMAVQTFHARLHDNVTLLVEDIHRALAPTRGAAVAVAQIDRARKLVRYVGVGNISAATVSGREVRRMVSNNGTAGHVAPRIREFTYPYSDGDMVLLHSDGLSSRWDLAQYPGLSVSHPSLLAGVLYRDHRRGRDDASVVAMKV